LSGSSLFYYTALYTGLSLPPSTGTSVHVWQKLDPSNDYVSLEQFSEESGPPLRADRALPREHDRGCDTFRID